MSVGAWPWTVEETYRYEPALSAMVAAGATAVVTSSDIGAVGCVKMLKSLGLQVPRDVSVVGFDDGTLAQSYDPRLTCVRQDIWGAAIHAVRMLLEVIESGRPSGSLRPLGDASGPLARGGPE